MWTIVARFVEAAASVSHYVREEPCATGLHMIVARGSTEDPGLGRIGVVARNVSLLIPGSTISAIDYPATFENYTTSEEKGAMGFEKMLIEYHEKCPDTKVALLGYSQGAQAMMDSVCGGIPGEGSDYQASKGYLEVFNESVVAAVAYGDPSHTAGAPWNLGTSTKTGIFPRENTTSCLPLASHIASWCDTGDIYCDSGSSLTVHGSYFANYTMDSVEWIVEKYKASGGNSTSTDSTPSSTSTGVAVPTGSGTATGGATASASASGKPAEGAAVSVRGSGVMVLAGVVGAVGMGLGLF